MREENMDIIMNNMFMEPEKRTPLTPSQQDLLEQVTDCYNLQLQRPMYSRVKLRNYLVNKYNISKRQAYNIILYANYCLGNVQASHKNWVRQKVEFLTEEAYTAAKAGNYKLSDQLTKIAKVLAKAFNTNEDEGELLNAQQYLKRDPTMITLDPTVLGINISVPEQQEIDRLKKKYGIEDVPFEEVTTTEETTE
ncbi:MAG: hypothetical protein K6A94_00910 [Bacteroidales bacterium]|nr:hypothetical protein [Bacteroidales bacterium]